MKNPFEDLGKPRAEDLDIEQWGGIFECQTFRCLSIVKVAKYIRKEKLLTWICEEGHTNAMEYIDD